MSREVIITLDGEQPETLNKKHAGQFWKHRADRAKAERLIARDACPDEPVFDNPVIIHAVIYYETKHRRDIGNADIKSYIDGIVDAGLLVDDDHRYVKTVAKTWELDRQRPRIEFRITEIGAA